MTATILTGAAGSGKTAYVIEQILRAEATDFGREIWVLLPTRLQSEAFRDRLMAQAGRSTIFNVRFFEFYELYDLLLDLAASPQRTIGSSAGDRILRQVIWNLQAEGWLRYYDKIAHTPGFVALVSRFIKELKQGVITLEDFERVAHSPKDYDLVAIYTGYQEFLQDKRLVDRDGAGWVALEYLKTVPDLVKNVGLLVVDGFDNFNPLQARLLGELTRQIEQTCLTLTYEAERQVDRSFRHTLDRLQKKGNWQVVTYPRPVARQTALNILETRLFTLHPEPTTVKDELLLIEAPDPRAEVKAVLREVKKLLLEGVSPEQIAIGVRDSQRYTDALRSAALAYGLPVTVRQSQPLLENPAVRVVLNLLDLHTQDFPRRHMLDLLRSPYLSPPDFTLTDIDLLERLSLEKPIVRGQAAWLQGLKTGVQASDEDHEREGIAIPEHLLGAAETFFARLTPPPEAPPRDYIAWLENLLGHDPAALAEDESEQEEITPTEARLNHFNLYGCVRGETDSAVVIRDIYALRGLRSALQEILGAYDLLETPLLSWESFRADLELALGRRTLSDQAARSRTGRVLITSVFEMRGLPHDYVFIMGLAEGIFPQATPEDALYSDLERSIFEQQGLDVETAAERAKEAGLFYEMCALAQTRLILSRPTLDDGGNEWMPSIFWRMVTDILPTAPLNRVQLGAAPALAEAANLRELTVGLSHALSQPVDQIDPLTWQVAAWMSQRPLWRNLAHGRSLELSRENPAQPFDLYSGILSDPALIKVVAEKLSPQKIWSASQFNELGQCGFRFFASRLLALEPYEEPEEGLDVLQLGSLYHKILERTYQRLTSLGVPIAPDYAEAALETLRQIAEEELKAAPREFGFQATRFWEQEQQNILAKLERLIKLDFSPDSPITLLLPGERSAYWLEMPFGAKGYPPLAMEGASGTLKVRGFIDRVDRVGNTLVVMDYKSGTSTPTRADLLLGRNFQMLIYLLAVKQRVVEPHQVLGGVFWSIQANKTGDALLQGDELLEEAQDQLHDMVLDARAGRFPNKPKKLENGKCSRYCEFSRLCRVRAVNRNKPL